IGVCGCKAAIQMIGRNRIGMLTIRRLNLAFLGYGRETLLTHQAGDTFATAHNPCVVQRCVDARTAVPVPTCLERGFDVLYEDLVLCLSRAVGPVAPSIIVA